MSVHLEIYITDAAKRPQAIWRHTLYDVHQHSKGLPYMLYTKEGQQWLFPSGGVESGEHYDTRLDTYVVWLRMEQPADFGHFGFTQMEKTR